LVAYQWSPITGLGAKQVLALSSLTARNLDVSPSGSHIAVVGISAATLKPLAVVPWTGTAFGGPVIDSSQTVSSGDAVSVKFTPDGSQIAIGAGGAGNGNLIYPFSGGVLGSPSTLPGTFNAARCITFDSAGNTIYLGQFFSGGTANTRIAGWKRSASGQFNIPIETGTSLLIASAVQSLSMSPLDNLLVAGMASSVLPLNAYRLSGGSILHRYADPRTMPTGGVFGRQAIAFSPSGDAVAICHQNSPFVTAYKITTN
jgi:WD40 repeat protein